MAHLLSAAFETLVTATSLRRLMAQPGDSTAPQAGAAPSSLYHAPRVSVIIPAHNAAETLSEAIQSLKRQTMRAWEAVIVDDGSTDATAQVAARLQQEDARIRLIQQPPGGVSRARNRGLEEAQAEWVLFLDADDWVAPNLFARMFEVLARKPHAGVAYCPSSRVADGHVISPANFPPLLEKKPFETLAKDCAADIHSIMVRRALVREVGGFDPTLRTNEDWDLWVRVARTGAQFVAVPGTVVYYRLRSNSASNNYAQMIQDGRTVTARISRPDPRVKNPDPRYAAGSSDGNDAERRGLHALWFATVRAGAGYSGLTVFQALESLPDLKHKLEEICSNMFYALVYGARQSSHRLAALWPKVEGHVLEICETLEAASTRKTLKAAILDKLIRRILDSARLHTPAKLWRYEARRHDLRRDGLTVSATAADVDRVYLKLRYGRLPLGDVVLPLLGPLPEPEFARLVLECWGLARFAKFRGAARWLRVTWRLFMTSAHALKALLKAKSARRLLLRDMSYGVSRGLVAPRLFKALDRTGGEPAPSAEAETCIAMARVETAIPSQACPAPALAAPALRADVNQSHTVHVPILMYHRIADDPVPALKPYCVAPRLFEDHLRYLKDNRYQSISPAELLHAIQTRRPLSGRPILITFDDGFTDFRTTAWPLLRQYGFNAEVFIVTGKVGGTADWDREYGPTAPLMSWEEIATLSTEGVGFGSHLVTHRHADALPIAELVREGASSRVSLEAVLRKDMRAIAYPYGSHDGRTIFALQWVGYRIGFTTDDRVSSIRMEPMALPRVHVKDTDDMASFAKKLIPSRRRPEPA